MWIKNNFETIEEMMEKRNLTVPKSYSFIRNIKEAANLCKKCIRAGMDITIVGDYDCDGITSTSILYESIMEYVNLLGTKNVVTYIIPNRYTEGYGLNVSIVDRITSGLMITVDNGISAVEQLERAKEKGLFTIVIDHHLVRDDGKIPNVNVLVDPHQDDSVFKDYCGAGLAYRFALELHPQTTKEAEFLSLAAIGTIADVMPLVGDNRKIVIGGLKNIAERKVLPGLNRLLDVLQIDEYVNEDTIGFKIGPCFNALGRMRGEGGREMVDVITSHPMSPEEDQKLTEKANEVVQTNKDRQELVLKEMALVNDSLKDINPVIVFEDSTMFTKGTIGIVAGRLTEKYKRPAVVFTTDTKNSNNLSGSGRAPEGVHLKNLLDKAGTIAEKEGIKLFCGYGGHAGAAGLTIPKENLPVFQRIMNTLMKDYKASAEDFHYDLDCTAPNVPALYEKIKKYAPYGEGNPAPVVRINNLSGIPKIIGEFRNHFKIQGPAITVLGFEMVEEWNAQEQPTSMDVIGTLGVNRFKDMDYYQIRILDFQKIEETKTDLYSSLEELFSF